MSSRRGRTSAKEVLSALDIDDNALRSTAREAQKAGRPVPFGMHGHHFMVELSGSITRVRTLGLFGTQDFLLEVWNLGKLK